MAGRAGLKLAFAGFAIWFVSVVLAVAFGDYIDAPSPAAGAQPMPPAQPESGEAFPLVLRSLAVAAVLGVALLVGTILLARLRRGSSPGRADVLVALPPVLGVALILAMPLPARWGNCEASRVEHGAIIPAVTAPVVITTSNAPVSYFRLEDRHNCPSG